MKIKEFIVVSKDSNDTTSSGTTSSAIKGQPTQDIVPQDLVPEMVDGTILEMPDHSAITEGVSQIFRRKKGGQPTKGFRCTSGTRKGRIVAKPSTCFAKTDPVKSAKIRTKRKAKARIAGKKLAMTKRSGAGSKRLKGIQIGGKRQGKGGKSTAPRVKSTAPRKSSTVKPKK
jgi:hypothetical protein